MWAEPSFSLRSLRSPYSLAGICLFLFCSTRRMLLPIVYPFNVLLRPLVLPTQWKILSISIRTSSRGRNSDTPIYSNHGLHVFAGFWRTSRNASDSLDHCALQKDPKKPNSHQFLRGLVYLSDVFHNRISRVYTDQYRR